jgi:hypothetical protein
LFTSKSIVGPTSCKHLPSTPARIVTACHLPSTTARIVTACHLPSTTARIFTDDPDLQEAPARIVTDDPHLQEGRSKFIPDPWIIVIRKDKPTPPSHILTAGSASKNL